MTRVVSGIAIMVIGIATLGAGFAEISPTAEDVIRDGVTIPGEIVAIDGGKVEIEFSLAKDVRRSTAHPTDAGSLEVGQFVTVSVLRDRPDRIVIHGSGETSSVVPVLLLIAGALAVITGVGVVLMQLISTPVAGTFPRFSWTRERHGGA